VSKKLINKCKNIFVVGVRGLFRYVYLAGSASKARSGSYFEVAVFSVSQSIGTEQG